MRRSAILCAALVAALVVLVPGAGALSIRDAVPPAGTVGAPYALELCARDGSGSPPLEWAIPHSGILPPGLGVTVSGDTRCATIAGVPTQAGSFAFFVELRDKPGPWVCCTQERYVITIEAAPAPPPPPPPPPPAEPVLELRVVAETSSTITLGWSPPAGAAGYRFVVDGRAVSRTFDPSRSSVRFGKGASSYRVEVLELDVIAAGEWRP